MSEKIKILVVDDVQNDQNIIKDVLEKQGYIVCQASTGEEAVERAAREKPNIVILDVILPGMNGFEACRKIKNIEGLKTNVIILTGEFEGVNILASQKVGADEFCVKTRDLQILLNAIRKIVIE